MLTSLDACANLRTTEAEVESKKDTPIDMVNFRKCLETLRADMTSKFFLHKVPDEVKSKVRPVLDSILQRVDAKHKEQMKTEVTTRVEELKRARNGLVKLAYGNTAKPEAWSATLKANVKLDDLVSFAEKQGLFDFDAEQLKVELADFKIVEKALSNTMAISGAVHEDDSSDE